MSKGIIVAGFGAIGKTTLQQKYKCVIDMESSMYQWDNVGFEDIPYEKRKGTTDRKKNKEWPQNYFKAILEAQEKYKIVLTSMHWDLLNFFENNNIEYYLAFPSLDSEKILEKRCYDRGNNKVFVDKLKNNLKDWYYKINDYNPIKILNIDKNEYLKDILKKENLL